VHAVEMAFHLRGFQEFMKSVTLMLGLISAKEVCSQSVNSIIPVSVGVEAE